MGIERVPKQRVVGNRAFEPDEKEVGEIRIGYRVVVGWIGEPDSRRIWSGSR